MVKPPYLSIELMLEKVPGPNGVIARRIYREQLETFTRAYGSSRNHQAWEGGYHDHVTEVMNIAIVLHDALSATGRPVPTLGGALLVLFLHDDEKRWRFLVGDHGTVIENPLLTSKDDKKAFREKKLLEYGIVLSPDEENAMRYVEGEHEDYSNKRRVSGPLAAFCHLCDSWSARGWHDFPAAAADPWLGATRVRP